MKITSAGFQTNLMFARFSGTVTDHGSYTLIQTPVNPGFYWGNYLIFDRPPTKGDLKDWLSIFKKHFTYYSTPHHYLFAWQANDKGEGEYQEFVDAGFERDHAVVLTTPKLNPPPHLNDRIEIRKIKSDGEWKEVVELQVKTADPKYLNDHYRVFKTQQMAQYRKMSEAGKGFWFGAFIEGRLVGDLGIFAENGVGRYQSVGTDPDYRRQGICGTLVYKAGEIAVREFKINKLVMEADPEYHAARIYESVGFKRNEINYSLCWWNSKGPLKI